MNEEELRKLMQSGFEKLRPQDDVISFKDIIAWLEKQGEQKPDDNIEPKFKNGQWLVWQDKCYKVNYNGCEYKLVDQNGLSTSLEYGTIDENAHIWDITKDAKDGDVLKEDSCTFIIERMKPNGTAIIHCCLFDDGDFCLDSTLSFYVDDTYPATKEQRDTLMKAMKEAGYTFDFEKKELKKIENEIEIPFGAKDSELQEATYYIPKGFNAEINGNKVIIKKG